MSVVGIVPAGGSGERLGADRPKAFVVCAGRPLIDWSLEVLEAVCDRVVVAAPPDWLRDGLGRGRAVALGVGAQRAGGGARGAHVRGARRRAAAGDAASWCEACIGALMGVDGAIAAAPVTDTVKEAYPDGTVLRTLDRSRLWAVQTPQVFRAEALRRALDVDDAALAAATDDASLVEAAGGTVRLVEAPRENLKVTTEADLARAEAALC